MKEYTMLAVFSVFTSIIADKVFKTELFKKGIFWIFLLIIFCFKLLVNGYLTGANIVLYNPRFFVGLRLGTIPLEDFLFGFSMVSFTLIFWEYFKGKLNEKA